LCDPAMARSTTEINRQDAKITKIIFSRKGAKNKKKILYVFSVLRGLIHRQVHFFREVRTARGSLRKI
jgi:hypothetical protein